MKFFRIPKKSLVFVFVCCSGWLFLSGTAKAQTLGTEVSFNVDPSYDYAGRSQVDAFLEQVGQNAYFYVESDYYQKLSPQDKADFSTAINNLSQEFDNTIYPKLTQLWGSEEKPGIDGDNRITVLLFDIKSGDGGYFNSADEYPKIQFPNSNQREMVYLNVDEATSSLEKDLLAHEFTHLITFNQKDKINGVTEETWLNELRAEYSPTYLGYNDVYQGSYLQQRVKDFLENPSDSLTAWFGKDTDYGVVDLFGQYLVDHYGVKILSDSLKSPLVGIASINQALQENGYQENFNLVFNRWVIATLLNDCSYGKNYCYLDKNLANFRIAPTINFLPTSGDSSLSVLNATYDWSGNWYKIVGGEVGTLTLSFDGDDSVKFQVPYLYCDQTGGNCQIQTMSLDQNQKGQIVLPNFNSKYYSLYFMPLIEDKTSGFSGFEPTYTFSWKVSISNGSSTSQAQDDSSQIQALTDQINSLKTQIASLQAQIAALLGGSSTACQSFQSDLYFGMSNSQQVECLQTFLKNQGTAIYPEGLVTGNFYSLTQAAVKRYQAEKGIIQTGYFGPLTRAAANSDL